MLDRERPVSLEMARARGERERTSAGATTRMGLLAVRVIGVEKTMVPAAARVIVTKPHGHEGGILLR